jgi:Domain of unknown function (DUF4399)
MFAHLRPKVFIFHRIFCSLLALLPVAVTAQPIERQVQDLHPWQVPRVGSQAQAYFSNLSADAKIETPFVVKFGLSDGWGLAPISAPVSGKSGHHHLLIDRELPLDFKKPLPFNEQYIHFGKGQMESVLNLAPGTYNLRMLLADDKHLPHFVYSKPMRITVTKKNAGSAAPTPAAIELLNLAADAKLRPPFRLQFHASGFQIAHQAQKLAGTGHFRLNLIPRSGGKGAELNLANGQTEVWLQPPPGTYTAKLQLVDNQTPGKVLAEASSKELTVLN